MNTQELKEKIRLLKKSLGAVLLVHNYQRPEVQEIADYMGDSLDLAKRAKALDNPVIVFCGVHFMAESAKILNPTKKVLLPEPEAGCPLADCATPEQVKRFRSRYPEAVFIAYINTSAAVKAECDCCCTSANAVKIIRHFDKRDIVYLPDKNLAAYAEYTLNRPIIKWPGQCYVHDRLISPETVDRLKQQYPDAVVMAHPETHLSILKKADVVTGTSGMLKEVERRNAKYFIVVTEIGLVDRMRRDYPDKVFVPLTNAVCAQMKLTTLNSVYRALLHQSMEIQVPEKIAERARVALEKMLELSV
jgi:quinolinate synthase